MNTADKIPKVSIALPVYNGQNYVAEALDAILCQTHREFELIICDNASTDRTAEICREYMARDDRIRYHRNEKNIGAGPNFNRAFELARGEYFKWIAHDDLHKPEFLAKCFEVLESEPDVVLAYTRAIALDGEGQHIKEFGYQPLLSSDAVHIRFRGCVAPFRYPVPLPLFGLIRADVLRRTHLQGSYPACDLVLIAELALIGKFREIDAPLYIQRNCPTRAGIVINDDLDLAADFWNPDHKFKLSMFYWVILGGFVKAARTMPLRPRERLRCFLQIPSWINSNRRELLSDLWTLCKRIPVLGPAAERFRMKFRMRNWRIEVRKTGADIRRHLPEGVPFVLLDRASFSGEQFAQHAVPLIQRDGRYFGDPKDDRQAIGALSELQDRGVRFVVFARPCYWWFDHYRGFMSHLRSCYDEVFRNRRITIYECPAARPVRHLAEHTMSEANPR